MPPKAAKKKKSPSSPKRGGADPLAGITVPYLKDLAKKLGLGLGVRAVLVANLVKFAKAHDIDTSVRPGDLFDALYDLEAEIAASAAGPAPRPGAPSIVPFLGQVRSPRSPIRPAPARPRGVPAGPMPVSTSSIASLASTVASSLASTNASGRGGLTIPQMITMLENYNKDPQARTKIPFAKGKPKQYYIDRLVEMQALLQQMAGSSVGDEDEKEEDEEDDDEEEEEDEEEPVELFIQGLQLSTAELQEMLIDEMGALSLKVSKTASKLVIAVFPSKDVADAVKAVLEADGLKCSFSRPSASPKRSPVKVDCRKNDYKCGPDQSCNLMSGACEGDDEEQKGGVFTEEVNGHKVIGTRAAIDSLKAKLGVPSGAAAPAASSGRLSTSTMTTEQIKAEILKCLGLPVPK